MQGYGCWCHFEEFHGKGRGVPVDGYDNACMHYHHGVQCAIEDFSGCDPAVTNDYLVVSKPDPNDAKNTIYDCEKNTDGCKKATEFIFKNIFKT